MSFPGEYIYLSDEKRVLDELVTYQDNSIILIDRLVNVDKLKNLRLESYIVTLVLKGSLTGELDSQTIALNENDAIICHPNSILERSSASPDFECRVIGLAPNFADEISSMIAGNWDVKMYFNKYPVLHLSEEETRIFCQYFDLLHSKLTSSTCSRRNELVGSLMKAFFYEFADIVERYIKLMPTKFSAGESIFKRFMKLLESEENKHRSVEYYATKLCISPKYLSVVCKKESGSTAMEIISKFVANDIRTLLRSSNLTIKEIAYKLDFPSLSFFGKYVKKNLGLSPRRYRQMCRKSELVVSQDDAGQQASGVDAE